MAAFAWPPQLPQTPNRSIPMIIETNVLRSQFDHGPAYQRRLYTAVPEYFEILIVIPTDSLHTTFWDWYLDVLLQVNRFDWKHPRTDAASEVRFLHKAMPRSRFLERGEDNIWELSFGLEVPAQ